MLTMNMMLYKFAKAVMYPIVKLFYRLEVKGIDNLDKMENGYILCSNHLSNWDPIFLILLSKAPIRFMAKEELFKNKIFRWFFHSIGAFEVRRGKGDSSAIKLSNNIIKNKENLGIFIEGTRSKNGDFLRPKSGVSVIAASTNANILPVCITGLSKNNKIKIFHRVKITFGKPIFSSESNIDLKSRIEIKKFTEMIMSKIKELRNI